MIDQGGTAYPQLSEGCPFAGTMHNHGKLGSNEPCPGPKMIKDPGMSLLDWFAGQYLQGLASGEYRGVPAKQKAEWAYDKAEAMIAEKRRRESK